MYIKQKLTLLFNAKILSNSCNSDTEFLRVCSLLWICRAIVALLPVKYLEGDRLVGLLLCISAL